jgi:hypothetical protein
MDEHDTIITHLRVAQVAIEKARALADTSSVDGLADDMAHLLTYLRWLVDELVELEGDLA